MSTVYILLPVHNRRDITETFIQCLLDQTYENYHLILIDDGSTDGTSEMVLEKLPNTTVIKGNGGLWWAGSLQKGIDWLNANVADDNAIVLIVNDDVTFNSNFLYSAVKVVTLRKNQLILAKVSYDDGKTIQESGVTANFEKLIFDIAKTPEKINCLSTRGLFLRLKDIKKIGGFYPRVLPHYLSDYEYTIRAHKMGFCCVTIDSVYLCPNNDTTGFHEFNSTNFFEFIKQYFSKKSSANPFYWSVFVILIKPNFFVLPALAKIWIGASKQCVKQFFLSIKTRLV